MKKKALAVLYSPKTLYDFIWYYATYGQDYEWDALCLPYGKSIKIKQFCKNIGIFNRIFYHEALYKDSVFFQKIYMFVPMLFYWLLGKPQKYAKIKIEQIVRPLDYDLHVVGHQDSLIAGYFFALADNTRTCLLEDGTGDYLLRHRHWIKDKNKHFLNTISFILAKMGYADITMNYWLENFQYCDNFVVHPEKMQEHGYRSIQRIRDFSKTNQQLYNKLLRKTFPLSNDILVASVVLFTAPMVDFTTEISVIWDQTVEYLRQNYPGARVIVKKHPRDMQKIGNVPGITLTEIDPLIPGEVLLDSFGAMQHIFMFPSTVLMDQKIDNERVYVLYYKNLNNTGEYKYDYEVFERRMQICGIPMKQAVTISE